MRQLIKQWRACKRTIEDLEEAYDAAAQQYGEPPPWLVALPATYKYVASKEGVDKNAIAMVGQYLSSKFPPLREQFLTDKDKESIELFRRTIDDVMKDHE